MLGRPVHQSPRRQARSSSRRAPGRYEAQAGAARRGQLAGRARGARAADAAEPSTARGGALAQALTLADRARASRCASTPAASMRRAVTTTLAVENMHCGGCMRKVEQALAAVPGVVTRARQPVRAGASPRCTARPASTPPTSSRRWPAPASRPPSCADDATAAGQGADRDLLQRARRRRLRRRQHHAAVGLGVVGRGAAT